MSTSVDVNEPSASAKSNLTLHGGETLGHKTIAALSTSFPFPQDRTIGHAEGWTRAATGLLIAVGLVLFVVGTMYLRYAGIIRP
jgi:hypothetical protein